MSVSHLGFQPAEPFRFCCSLILVSYRLLELKLAITASRLPSRKGSDPALSKQYNRMPALPAQSAQCSDEEEGADCERASQSYGPD